MFDRLKCIFSSRLVNRGNITINGQTYAGDSVSIQAGGKVIIDGKKVDSVVGPVSVAIEGACTSVSNVSGPVMVQGDVGGIATTSGDVTVRGRTGNVETVSGDVHAESIAGNVRTVSGDVHRG